MFLRCSKRLNDGKEHFYWSVVENRRPLDGRVVQRHVLYLGELNGRQEALWRKSVALFDQEDDAPRQVALFTEEFVPVESADDSLPIVRVRLRAMSLRRPRQWGACWLGCELLATARASMSFGAITCAPVAKARARISSREPHWSSLPPCKCSTCICPPTDVREIILTRHTRPEKDLQLLLDQLHPTLPEQPPPRITTAPPKSPPQT